MSKPDFNNLTVLVLESRRSREMATLVTTYGGTPVVAPALREVPIQANTPALNFAEALIRGEFDLLVLLTGVGTRALLEVVDGAGRRDAFVEALGKTKIAVRGPKPLAVIRELGIPPWVLAPEPNTWHELLAAIDATGTSLKELKVAVQEYGTPNQDLLSGLEARGARVTPVPVYRWALPEDVEPLREAVRAVAAGMIDVVLVTTATQIVHLFQVAAAMHQEDALRKGFQHVVLASIGPTSSEELRQRGLMIDLEASHPKMGQLVRDAAERAADLIRSRRAP
jgi:uroporphyrinogen-III synthase